MKKVIPRQFRTDNRKPDFEEKISILKKLMPEIRHNYGVKTMGVFGSYVSGMQRQSSDIDILIDFERAPTFFSFIRLENYLTKELGVKTDLVMKDTLKPAISRRVLSEVVQI